MELMLINVAVVGLTVTLENNQIIFTPKSTRQNTAFSSTTRHEVSQQIGHNIEVSFLKKALNFFIT